MTRANARELAVHFIYSQTFTREDPQVMLDLRLDKEYYDKLSSDNEIYNSRPSGPQLAYVELVVTGVANRLEELNQQIQSFSISWDISRISRLARSIMQLAIFEILYVEDVPAGVAISEAVRLTKKYDGDETGAFVNGILGSFVRSLEAEDK